MAVIVALLLAAAGQPDTHRRRMDVALREPVEPGERVEPPVKPVTTEADTAAAAGISLVFWILLMVLVLAVFAAYA